ncbi:PAAR domain-containing protein [Paraburkholderia sp. J7]|uniref:PAAR domain-containing protein n=1 Tax=Paraburkholderia sp. J7 TaxID=2805438 RepID=UPI002AB606DA|nr:PAAR domain-containing protein [Paraburkholderia sp. J7]
MRRAILKLGDKTTAGGVVLEGVDGCTHHGTPLTFIGAKIWCPACNSEGVIGWNGPHRKATMRGKQQALEGDLCLCRCDPPPVLIASQNSAWHVFEACELAGTRYASVGTAGSAPHRGIYDEQYTLKGSDGRPLAGMPYRIVTASGRVINGTTNGVGQTKRIETDGKEKLKLYTTEGGENA